MRRFLLSLTFLFFFFFSKAQVLLNEMYTSPKDAGNSEFFELFNTSSITPVNLDSFALVVFYIRPKCNGNACGTQPKNQSDTIGFYVMDLPNLTIQPHNATGQLNGYMVGSAKGPDYPEFTVQNAETCASSNFVWNELNTPGYLNNSGSLIDYRICSSCTNPNGWSRTYMSFTNDFFIQNQTVATKGTDNIGGFTFGIFLFSKSASADTMVYVNGFLGGNNDGTVPNTITNIGQMPILLRSAGRTLNVTINWTNVKKAENVIETTGEQNADNGFIRCNDGKCGDWEKSSNPDNDCSKTTPGEHTPRYRNGAGLTDPVGLTLSTQTSVCGTRIDFKVSGTQGKGSCVNQTRTKDLPAQLFPMTVYLYKDVDNNNALTDKDQYMKDSIILTAPTTNYFSFFNLTEGINYLLLFKSALGCIDKIVPITTIPLLTLEKNYCGNQIDLSIDTANYNTGRTNGNLAFEVNVYHDADNDGKYDQGETLIAGPYTITSYDQILTIDLPTAYEGQPYVVVYSSDRCAILTKADPAPATVPTLTTAQIYSCGDNITGDLVTFDVISMTGGDQTGALPISVELWKDENGDGTGDQLLQTKTQATIEEGSGTFNVLPRNQNLILIYRTGRGCPVIIRLLPNCAPLPVNFGTFTAARNKQKVLLKWETLTEQLNRGFNVQRNTKGVWETRAFVFSAADGGNSTQSLKYSFNDDNNEKGVSQYRIQQVDMDGKVTYTPIRSVRGEGQATRTIIYPNPSGEGKVNVVFEDQGSRDVIVSDINGRIIRQHRNVVNSLVIDNLDAGMYLLQITDLSTAETSVEKVIIKKR